MVCQMSKEQEKGLKRYLEFHLDEMRRALSILDSDELEDVLQHWLPDYGEEPDDPEEAKDIIMEYHESFGLNLDRMTAYHLQMSWGGPGDGFYIMAKDNDIEAIFYYYQDWFQPRILIPLEPRDFETARQFFIRVLNLLDF